MKQAQWQTLADAQGRVSGATLARLAQEHGWTLGQAELACCRAGYMPARYGRNAHSLGPAQQSMLLESRVLLVGLGGLGGHVLDMLARMGVGHVTGVDGDVFEESNANRQLLCDAASYGSPKTEAAQRHVARVNPATEFVAVPRFLQGDEFSPLVQSCHVVVDALGGLTHRLALHEAALKAGKCVVSAGIAGLSGWVAVLRPGETNPVALLMDNADKPAGQSVEESLGNLAPTVCTAAALQCAEILKLLTGQQAATGLLCFDLSDQTFTPIHF